MRTDFDHDIERAAARWLPFLDWRWYKAELMAESQLDPFAHSPAGAEGIAQFMPATWAGEVVPKMHLPPEATAWEPDYAIPAGAWYLRQQWNFWRSPRPMIDRIRLMQASYNAGAGSLEAAQKLAGGTISYALIAAQLPNVTGAANAKQTREYVARIAANYARLAGAGT